MNRKETKKLLPAITHFASGGDLWWYDIHKKIWRKQDGVFYTKDESCNIIEDKHFESRKAFALGEEIEYEKYTYGVKTWVLRDNDSWFWSVDYRPKPKEVYEWQWTYKINKTYHLTDIFYTEKEANDWVKFEPSKRIRKR